MSSDSVRLYRTVEHACGYFTERRSQNLVLDPESPHLAEVYGRALEHGFRRAGNVIYRPDCPGCKACVPYRLDVAAFRPDRGQRRVLQRNQNLECAWVPARAEPAHFRLYQRYLQGRHAAGGMDDATPEDQSRFLLSQWATTHNLEVRLAGELIAVAVTDLVPRALSAVYTYFAPEYPQRSLGTYAILQQIEHARRTRREHLYLGYWIDAHPKMHYKRRYAPAEVRIDESWQAADGGPPAGTTSDA